MKSKFPTFLAHGKQASSSKEYGPRNFFEDPALFERKKVLGNLKLRFS
jgi:hypothetical protein